MGNGAIKRQQQQTAHQHPGQHEQQQRQRHRRANKRLHQRFVPGRLRQLRVGHLIGIAAERRHRSAVVQGELSEIALEHAVVFVGILLFQRIHDGFDALRQVGVVGRYDVVSQLFTVRRYRSCRDERFHIPLRILNVSLRLLRQGGAFVQQADLDFAHRQRGGGARAHQVAVALIERIELNALDAVDHIQRSVSFVNGNDAHDADRQQQQRHKGE